MSMSLAVIRCVITAFPSIELGLNPTKQLSLESTDRLSLNAY